MSHNQEITMTKVRTRHTFAAFGCALLTACSGAPSEGDIQGAVERQMKAEQESLAKIGGAELAKSMLPVVTGVKKIGCKEDGEKAYRCDVEVEVIQLGKTSKGPAAFRLVKLSDGWSVSR